MEVGQNRAMLNNIQLQVKEENNAVVSALGGVILNSMNDRNSLKMTLEADFYKDTHAIKKLVNKIEEKAHESKESAKKVLTKVEAVAGGVYEGVKTAARDVYEETDMALEAGPLSASSHAHLLNAETTALGNNLDHGVLGNVSIEDGKFIRTLCFQASTYHVDAKSPLVMLHGLGGGIPSFHKNFKGLYKDREVYAIDLPGFALSTRMQFVGEAEDCIRMYVEMLDKWRQKLKINKFAILGHSFGGYIASAYAVRYPARIESLILVDPWGIMPQGENDVDKGSALWQKGATELAGLLKGAPFGMLRSTGPLAPLVGELFVKKHKAVYGDSTASYFIHTMLQNSLATGEHAFSIISSYQYLWAKHPMKTELILLDDSIPITFIYGKESPFSNSVASVIKEKRRNVYFPQPIENAGHHVHAQCPDEVNSIIQNILEVQCSDRCCVDRFRLF